MTSEAQPAGRVGTSYRRLSRLLDSSIPLPGGMRIGLDGILGLFPGVGDAIGGLLSMVIIYHAHQLGAPKTVLLRMALNIAIDSLVGAIPIVGDIFDFFWKANEKNVRLLDAYQHNPRRVRRRSAASSAAWITIILAVLGAVIYLAFALVVWLWRHLNLT